MLLLAESDAGAALTIISLSHSQSSMKICSQKGKLLQLKSWLTKIKTQQSSMLLSQLLRPLSSPQTLDENLFELILINYLFQPAIIFWYFFWIKGPQILIEEAFFLENIYFICIGRNTIEKKTGRSMRHCLDSCYGYNYKQWKYIHDLFTVFTYLFDSASFLFA